MSATTLRQLTIFVIAPALLILAACGSSPRACNEAGCCGTADLCVAPRYLFANGINGQVASFSVEGNGGLSAPTSTSGPVNSLGMAELNNQFLYASSPTVTLVASSIEGWSINFGTGALTPVPGSPFTQGIFNAEGLVACHNLNFLYAADAGQIDGFKADATGALSPVPGSPFFSGTNLYLTVDPLDHYLFSSIDDPPGSVAAFTIDSTSGALTQVPGSPFATSSNLQGSTQPSQIVVDESGSFVFTPLTATGQVAAFAISSSGALTPVPGSPFTAGTQPISIATSNFGSAGNFLYVGNADGTISGYSITAASGVLAPLAGSPFSITAGALTINPLANVLYASNASGIRAFTIDPQTGALAEIAGSPFTGPAATVLTFVQ